jgi:hypothetical protein
MDEIFLTQEHPVVAVLRLNVDALGYLLHAESFEETAPTILSLIEKHSTFILELSDKISKSQRVELKAIK